MLNIHLGAHKTASTHLQYSLRLVRDELRGHGLAFIDPSLLRSEPVRLSNVLSHEPGSTTEAACMQELDRMRGDCPDLLLSEENILGGTHRQNMFSRKGQIYPDAAPRLARVIDLLGGGPATVFLALRDPAEFHTSAFALQLNMGNEIEMRPYLAGRDPARSFWAELVARLAALDQVQHLLIWRYEDYAVLRPRLLARLLPEGTAELVPEPPPSNESLTQQGYDWFLRRAMSDSEIDLRVLVRRARNRFPRSAGHTRLRLLDEAVHARSASAYAADIEAIRLLPKVQFLLP
ncbi:hypothetical protein [Paracoccus shanxieyensis]|uniref:Sulfotransferase family protein n=1 Tax=Paracoccus shanxieyensis TaxID=2675752 RepID=A0A6L6IRN2_9RHOB|nr:hypothetical protein [Paracoccus shanxieyensis]MTH63136.1 hypothetical protein [Paracoccus shanxieyensis]MTH87050.1 hypothetical protein [Paracoccus shanxieyensis]